MTEKAKARIPVVATLFVLLCAAAMIALGVWQLQRHREKQAAIATMRANLSRPSTSFPAHGPVPTETMFRASSVVCLRVAGWDIEAGSAADGSSGFRYIARCATGAEGQGALVTLGVGARPDLKLAWNGGKVTGRIVEEPDHRSLLSRMTGHALVPRPMLVADAAPAGLKTSAPPRLENVPNNHLGYAVQWFIFATTALLIYGLALRRRVRAI